MAHEAKKWEDPIVKEVRAIGRYYQQKQERAARKLVTRPPRRPDVPKAATH